MARSRFSVEAVIKAVDNFSAPVRKMTNNVTKATRAMSNRFIMVEKSLRRMRGGIVSVTKSMAKWGSIGVAGLAAAFTLLTREFSKIEDAQAAFTPLLGGAQKAKEMVDELNKTAATTPFQFENLAKQTSQLLPVMNGDIQNTIKTLRLLGDTAGGNAQKLDSITRGYTKAMLKGKVDMESLNMIAEAGVPIFTELSKSMGVKAGEEFFDMVSAGEVSTKELTKAFEKMTAKGGIFHKGMDIASKTTSGIYSTFKDNISLTAAAIGEILNPTVKELIKGATKYVQMAREWVKTNREVISRRFVDFVETLKVGVLKVVDAFKEFNKSHDILQILKNTLETIGNVISFVVRHGQTIATVTAVVVGLSVAMQALSAAIAVVNIVTKANPIVLIITAAIAAITLLITHFDKVKAFFASIWDLVKKIFSYSGIGLAIKAVKGLQGFLAKDKDDSVAGVNTEVSAAAPVTPQERVSKSIAETRETTNNTLTIKDETGRGEISSTGSQPPAFINLVESGAF